MATASAFLSIITVLVLMSSMSHAGETFQDFWKRMLPNTPMPSAVRNHLGDEPISKSPAVSGVAMDFGTKPLPLIYYSKKDGEDGVAMDFGTKPFPLMYYSKKDGEGGVAMDFGTKPFPLMYYSKKDGKGNIKEKKSDAGAVVTDVDGKMVAMDFGTKPFPLMYYSKKDAEGNNNERKSVTGAVVSGVDGKTVNMDFGTKPFPFRYYSKKDGENNNEKKFDAGAVVTDVDVKTVAMESDTGAVVSGVDGKTVNMDFGTKPFPFRYYSKKDGENSNEKKSDAGAVVTDVDGKTMAMDFGTKPFPLFYYAEGNNNEKKSDTGAVVSGVDGKTVNMDFGTKPFPFRYYSKKDGENNNEKKSDAGAVVTDVDGKTVAMDFGTKPFPFSYSSKKDGEKSNVDTKPFPFVYYSKKASAGAGAGGMHGGEASDATQDFIDRPSARSFFLQKDLRPGAKMTMLFRRRLSGDNFLHREVADTIPFSSDKIPDILRRFNVQPGSPMAESMERTIRHCEYPPAPGEQKLCATSFEAMVEFVTKSLGTNNVRTLTTVVGKNAPRQVYTVQSWSVVRAPGWAATICHIGDYPHTIFQCHRVPLTIPYVVRLVGEDGTVVDSAAACHVDTSTWSTTYYVVKAFNIKPGEVTMCHLLLEGEVIWIPGGDKAAVA